MSVVDFGTMDAHATLKQVIDELANLKDNLNFLFGGNIDFKNVRVGSITADRIKANTITALQIMAGTITADKLDVDQLSAITADMGTLTAGIIYGAYIATANGTYPRVDLSSVGNLLTAYFDAANHLDIIPDLLGVPAIRFTKASSVVGSLSAGGAVSLTSTIELDVGSTQNVFISAGTNLTARSAAGTITDIVTTINSKAPKGLAGTKVYYVSNTSGGAVTRKLTFTDGILTSET